MKELPIRTELVSGVDKRNLFHECFGAPAPILLYSFFFIMFIFSLIIGYLDILDSLFFLRY